MGHRRSTKLVNTSRDDATDEFEERVIDLEHLARQTAGDVALQQDLLILFLGQVEELRATLDAPRDRSGIDVLPLLHRLRGAAMAVGAVDLARVLAEAEAATAADATGSRDRLRPLRDALAQACAVLPSLIAAQGRGGLAKAGESR